jgi:hypothetical protein
MESNKAKALFSRIQEQVPCNLALDIQEDIAGDVLLALLGGDVNQNLQMLVEMFTEKNVTLFIKPIEPHISISELPTNLFGENKVTRIIDPETIEPLDIERFVVEID